MSVLDAVLVRQGRALPDAVRQRARLWELDRSLHCSVIGTCLTTGELRRVMAKLARADIAPISDHDLHAEAVGLAASANLCSRLINKTLDRCHAVAVRRFARLSGEAAVLAGWSEAQAEGDIPGAYWAVLTHPNTGRCAIRRVFGDVHMLSHLVGAANRADIRRLAKLEAENGDLAERLARAQARLRDEITARDATIARLSGRAARSVTPAQAPDDETSAALYELVEDLRGRLARETARCERLALRVAEHDAGRRSEGRRLAAAEATTAGLLRELAALERQGHATSPTVVARTVLYVGGHPGALCRIRDAIQATGGTLLCHDGGVEHSGALLAGLIGRADHVVFPVDCISHEAALAVKRGCRQRGIGWSALRSSGLGSFLAAMQAAPLSIDQEQT